ncbi:PAS domain-containing sensor histidine kinase [Arcticibacterium luteifluviistationis]|uniref:histidine kinase n=1 Tax=Arcticibacterium luteifluviistationis TaxID=1784714 RepID=A0A2Z4GGK8_9BACT|nr:PAS domain-containing sensor histidine kinase [Arcticibacterium luteifluviistationis]AWW00530.1 PAS domain-containing sensor histidine kinase [Arcticibacterium luteifluviistationis]
MKSSHQFDAVFLYANEAIIITNERGEIVRINPATERLFGYADEELISKRIDTLIPDRFRKAHDGHVKKYHQKPKPRAMGAGIDLFARKKDGREFPVEVSLSPCDINGTQMVIAFIIDITERKRTETQAKDYQLKLEQDVEDRTLILQEAIEKLENTKKKLDESLQKERELNQLKSRFISTASHEFRTPLATVLSSLTLVEKYIELNDTSKQEKHLTRIKKSISNLTDILNDILSVNKIDEGKIVSNPHLFNLNELLEDLTSELNLITKPGQKILLDIESSEDIEINQDPKLLSHIISNLLSNAIKFSHMETEIHVRVTDTDDDIRISIKDEGIGIPESDLENLFTRFFRSENAGQIQGTGLGLSIVNQYAELLNGNVECISKLHKGSEFILTIPKTLEA